MLCSKLVSLDLNEWNVLVENLIIQNNLLRTKRIYISKISPYKIINQLKTGFRIIFKVKLGKWGSVVVWPLHMSLGVQRYMMYQWWSYRFRSGERVCLCFSLLSRNCWSIPPTSILSKNGSMDPIWRAQGGLCGPLAMYFLKLVTLEHVANSRTSTCHFPGFSGTFWLHSAELWTHARFCIVCNRQFGQK